MSRSWCALAAGVFMSCGGPPVAGPTEIHLPAEAFAPLTANETLTTVFIAGVKATVWSVPFSNGQRGGVYAAVVVPPGASGKRPTLTVTVFTPAAGNVVQPLCVNYLPHDALPIDQTGKCFVAVGGSADSIKAIAGQVESAMASVSLPEVGTISAGDVYVVNFGNGNINNTAGTVDVIGAYLVFPP
ncbi:MAG TPA: hypothetical protein VF994_11085 [Myxococcales bacterium]